MYHTDKRYQKLMRCGDNYGYGLWLQENIYYKNQPEDVGSKVYADWLERQPLCGHKKCAGKRAARLAHLRAKKGIYPQAQS